MNSFKVLLAALLMSLVLFASPLFADNVHFIGATGPVVDGVYVAPYQLQDSAILGGATINVICDDFSDDVVPGETWNAQIETFNANGTVSPGALFGALPNSTLLYDDAIYIYSEFLSGSADAAGTNYAIWGLFDPSVVTSSAYTSTDAAGLLAGVTPLDLSSFNFSSYELITPTGAGSTGHNPQEYIYQTTPTPEPGNLLLLTCGMMGLGLMKRKVFQT